MPTHFLAQLKAAVVAKLTTPGPLAAVPDVSHYFPEKRDYSADLDLPAVLVYTDGFDRETAGVGGTNPQVRNVVRLVVRCLAASSGGNGSGVAQEIAKQVEERLFASPADRTLQGFMNPPLHRALIDGADEDTVHEDRAYAQVELRILATVLSRDGRPDLT